MTDPQGLLDQALDCQRAGHDEAASWICRAVLALAPDHADAHRLLGRILLRRDARDEGLKHLRRAVECAPMVGEHWLALAEGLLRADHLPEALRAVEQALLAGSRAPAVQALRQRIAATLAWTPGPAASSPPRAILPAPAVPAARRLARLAALRDPARRAPAAAPSIPLSAPAPLDALRALRARRNRQAHASFPPPDPSR